MFTFILKKCLPALLVLAYLILPFDTVPDFLGPLGRIDDVVLLGALVWYLLRGKGLLSLFRQPYRPTDRQRKTKEEPDWGRAENADKEDADPYKVLAVDPDAPTEEIHRAYRRQAARYHPDKVGHLGEEFQRLAHRKSIQLQQAYEQILRARGEKR